MWRDWPHSVLAELLDGQATEAGRMRVQRRLAELYFQLGEDEQVRDASS